MHASDSLCISHVSRSENVTLREVITATAIAIAFTLSLSLSLSFTLTLTRSRRPSRWNLTETSPMCSVHASDPSHI